MEIQKAETEPKTPASKKPEKEFRHEVLEDCIVEGIYRAKGEIIISKREQIPHCSAIE